MRKYIAAYAVFHLACATVSYGASLGLYQGAFPLSAEKGCRRDMGFSMLWSLAGGPVSLAAITFISGFYEHGFKWSCP